MKLLYLLLLIFLVILVAGSFQIKKEQFQNKNVQDLLKNPHSTTEKRATIFQFLNMPKGSTKVHPHDYTTDGYQIRKCDVQGNCIVDTKINF